MHNLGARRVRNAEVRSSILLRIFRSLSCYGKCDSVGNEVTEGAIALFSTNVKKYLQG
ncbi:hypothetical protein [Sinanaerobacter chloroacetimidivorans]|uniref:hypothetical protein n=1 Tax=Sinanaerobacter chloroacetimidivorans TaxID=2818044 RepID=UPI001D04A279|nr:hypothetical protein [Sinanaerobacter chloroacetimidivorans]